jgi:hypothetical protein
VCKNCTVVAAGINHAHGFVAVQPYDTVDGRIMTAVYGIDPYCVPYRSDGDLRLDGTGTVAVIRMPLSR